MSRGNGHLAILSLMWRHDINKGVPSHVTATKYVKQLNASNTNSFHSLTESSQPPSLHISTTSYLFNLLAALVLHLWLPLLVHQLHPRYVQLITPSGTPQIVSGINFLVLSLNLILAPLSLSSLFMLLPHLLTLSTHHSPSITPSLFHSRLKTYLSHKSLPPQTPRLRTDCTDFTTGPFLLRMSVFVFSFFIIMAALRSRCGHYIFALWFLSMHSVF